MNLILISMSFYILTFIIGFIVFLQFINSNISDFKWLNVIPNPLQVNGTPGVLFIMKNNLYAVLLLISGSFLFGTITFLTLALNGFSFGGLTCGMVLSGVPFGTIFLLSLPHAIFELPAIWIAGAAGFKIPYELVRYFNDKKDYILNGEEVIDFLILAGSAIVLTIVAAFVEANITLRIAQSI